MKISEVYSSDWLKAGDLQGRTIRVAISHVELTDLGDDRQKPVVYFKGKKKGLVLNKTNAGTIAAALGDDCESWSGEEIELFPQQVTFQGQMVPAIRVRVPQGELSNDEPLPF